MPTDVLEADVVDEEIDLEAVHPDLGDLDAELDSVHRMLNY